MCGFDGFLRAAKPVKMALGSVGGRCQSALLACRS